MSHRSSDSTAYSVGQLSRFVALTLWWCVRLNAAFLASRKPWCSLAHTALLTLCPSALCNIQLSLLFLPGRRRRFGHSRGRVHLACLRLLVIDSKFSLGPVMFAVGSKMALYPDLRTARSNWGLRTLPAVFTFRLIERSGRIHSRYLGRWRLHYAGLKPVI